MSHASSAPDDAGAADERMGARTTTAEAEAEAPIGLESYRYLWRQPGIPRLVVGYGFARLSVSVVDLALALATLQHTGSLALAGLVTAAETLAMAVSLPVTGRLVDRHGSRGVFWLTGVMFAASLFLFAGVVGGLVPLGDWTLVLLAAATGLSYPPISPVVRSLWTAELDAIGLRAVTAVESFVMETFYILGPALVGLLVALNLTPVGLAAAGLAMAVALFLVSGHGFEVAERSTTRSRRWAVLGQRGVPAVLVLSVAYATCSAGIELAVIAWAAHRDSPGLAGLVLAISCVGALGAAVAYGAGNRWVAGLTFPAAFGLWSIGLSAMTLTTALDLGFVPVVAAVALTEVLGAPVLPMLMVRMSQIAQPALRTESFAWRTSALMVGGSLGLASGGALADRAGALGPAALAVVVACAAIALAMTTMGRIRPRAEGR